MADRYSRIGMQQQQSLRLADVVTAPQNDGVGTLDLHIRATKELHHARRCACDERFVSEHKGPDIGGMKAIHILQRVDTFENGVLIDMLRKRKLDKDSVDRIVLIQIANL